MAALDHQHQIAARPEVGGGEVHVEPETTRQHAARLMFSKQTLQGQESERRRIAANLHDSLGQNLLVIKKQLHLAMQPVGSDPDIQRRLEEISNMAAQAIDEVRQITHDLRPYQLDRLGLSQTIRAAIRRVSENSTISFASDVEDSAAFDSYGFKLACREESVDDIADARTGSERREKGFNLFL